MRYFIFTFIFCFTVSIPVEAQILKKLKEKVTKSAEESVSKRMQEKADEQVEKGLDEVFESDRKESKSDENENPYSAQPVRNSSSDKKPPENYKFDYKLVVEMYIDNEEDMSMDYLLSTDGDYYAMEMKETVSMLMVTDAERKAMFQFMDYGGNKMMMVQDLNFSEEEQQAIEETSFKKLPNKTIMGYPCEGIELTNKDMRSEIYFTKEAPVNFTFFNDPEQSKNFSIPTEIEDIMNDDVLMMEMQMEDLNQGYQVLWKAKSLEKEDKQINTNGYRRM